MNPKRILVPTDLAGSDGGAFEAASDLARRSEAEILLLHVVEDPAEQVYGEKSMEGKDRAAWALWKHAQEEIEARLRTIAKEQFGNTTNVRTLCAFGDAATRITETAATEDVDLVVLSGRRRKSLLQGMHLGSVAYKVVRIVACNVLVVR